MANLRRPCRFLQNLNILDHFLIPYLHGVQWAAPKVSKCWQFFNELKLNRTMIKGNGFRFCVLDTYLTFPIAMQQRFHLGEYFDYIFFMEGIFLFTAVIY